MKRTRSALVVLCSGVIFACTAPRPTGGTGGSGGSAGTASGGAGGGTGTNLPCNIDAIFKAKCEFCHASPPLYGSPMALTSYADLHATRPSGELTYAAVQRRVSEGSMPPPGYVAPTDAEKAALADWVNASAPGSSETCTDNVQPQLPTGEQYLSCPKEQRKYFRANTNGQKYLVPAGTKDRYANFAFTQPVDYNGNSVAFAPGEVATTWAPVIDNPKVIHHYILYGGATRTFVAGWAPGGQNAVLPSDLGLVLDYPNFSLQVHYNNITPGAVDELDSSGIAFCTTIDPNRQPMGVITTGQLGISIPPGAQNLSVKGSCTNLLAAGEPVTIVAGSAHMHLLGVGFHTELYDQNGNSKAVITDVPMGTWSFDNQHSIALKQRIQFQPGDYMKTTCYYSNPGTNTVTFGEGTTDEMCFDFFSVYPVTKANRFCMDFPARQ